MIRGFWKILQGDAVKKPSYNPEYGLCARLVPVPPSRYKMHEPFIYVLDLCLGPRCFQVEGVIMGHDKCVHLFVSLRPFFS